MPAGGQGRYYHSTPQTTHELFTALLTLCSVCEEKIVEKTKHTHFCEDFELQKPALQCNDTDFYEA